MKDNMVQPLISIIIPCYNYGNFLPATLENVLKQQYNSWECVVIDDGSIDNTKEVVQSFALRDRRIRYIYQPNAGLPAARNTGIRETSGKYIQFLDADDLIAIAKTALQVAMLEENKEIDIVYGDARFFHTDDPDSHIGGRDKAANPFQYLKVSGSGEQLVRNFCINNFIEVSSPLITRRLTDMIGLFDETYKSYEDWQFWFRAAVEGAFFCYNPIPGTETFIRYGHTSMMTNKNKLVVSGRKIRRYMMPFLPLPLKIYNAYRLVKLNAKKVFLSLKGAK